MTNENKQVSEAIEGAQDVCDPLKPPEELAAMTMPAIAYHGLSACFVDALHKSTEAPREFLLAAFLTVVGALDPEGRHGGVLPPTNVSESIHAPGR